MQELCFGDLKAKFTSDFPEITLNNFSSETIQPTEKLEKNKTNLHKGNMHA